MYNYKLKYLTSLDDMDPEYLQNPTPVNAGDVILLVTSFYHYVSSRYEGDENTVLVLSKAAQSAREAKLIAKQLGH